MAAELAPMVSPSWLRQLRHPEIAPLSGDLGIPSFVKLLRLKSTLAAKNTVFLLNSVASIRIILILLRATAKFSFERVKKRFLKGRNLFRGAGPPYIAGVRDEGAW